MSDDVIAMLVCTAVLAAIFGLSAQRRFVSRPTQSYGPMYQPAQKPDDGHRA